jgi:DNA-binding winged helix-turn-helix (wHTH) protein/tetratricopeptide (TPR) repeat protein
MASRSLRFSSFTLDLDRLCLVGPAGKAELRPKSFEVLRYLLEHSGRVIGKEELIKAAWPDVTVTDESLTHCISEIRRAIGEENQHVIKTVPRRGYLLDAPISSDGATTTDSESTTAVNLTPPAGSIGYDIAAGERKQITVLCADLKGSLERIAEHDAEEALKIFEAALTLMTQAVDRFEGIVNVVTHDGIVALFGVPVAHEDHAIRACYAALQLQAAVTRYSEGVLRGAGALAVRVRVGLDSGEAVIRLIADGTHSKYRVVGRVANFAARLGQIAVPGTSIISAETLRLAEGHVEAKVPESAIVSCSGNSAYELVGTGPTQTRFQALAARGLTSFVGRSVEMEQLERVRTKAEQQKGQVVAIIGEPGQGKSRLLYEFIRPCHTSHWLVLETAAVSYRKAASYQPIIDLLKIYFKVKDRDDFQEMENKVATRLLDLDQKLAPDLSSILALLDIPIKEPSWEGLDASQRRQHILDALKHLILRECQKQPVIMAVEDLHWIDSETQAFLETLIDGLASVPLLLILTYRPEYAHRWGGKSYYTQLHLDALSPQNSGELLRSLIGSDISLGRLRELLQKQGNPLFLEESIRSLVEADILLGERGNYRLVRQLDELRIPSTVHAILAARIDRLPARERLLLQAASVVGKDIPISILQPIAELREDELSRGLAELQDAELLYEARLFPDSGYTFKHALTHEVAYATLLVERRQALHRRIMDVIERLYPDRLLEQVEILAHHALKGEAWEKAVRHCREAGAKAAARSAYAESVQYFEQALDALSHLPETHVTCEHAIDLRLALRTALVALNDFGRGLALLRETEDLAVRLGDSRRLAQVSNRLSNHLYYMGEMEQAVATAKRAVEIATAVGDDALLWSANLHLAVAQYGRGDFRQTIDSVTRTLAARAGAFEQTGRSELISGSILGKRHAALGTFADGLIGRSDVIARSLSAECHAELGMFVDGLVLGEEALSIAEAMAHPVSLLWALQGIGRLHVIQGNLTNALPLLERALVMCREANVPHLYPRIAVALGTAYGLSRRFTDAVLLSTEALQETRTRMKAHSASCHLSLGGVQLLAGCLQEAWNLADVALRQSREYRQRGQEAYSLRLLAEIATRRTPPHVTLAESNYRQALKLAEMLGMRPLVAHCHGGLGGLYQRVDDSRKAREHVTVAKEMYLDMKMQFYGDTMLS